MLKSLFAALAGAFVLIAAGVAPAAAAGGYKALPLDVVIGKPGAPVTVIEYFSMTCPHCARFAANILPRVEKEWIDTGKAMLVLRDFPLDDVALAAAMVAHCAGPRYETFVDTLFQTQETWATAKDPIAEIKTIVRLGGMRGEDVDACLKKNDLLNEINTGKEEATRKYGIDSTPSFIINGKLASGEMSYEEFAALLAAASK